MAKIKSKIKYLLALIPAFGITGIHAQESEGTWFITTGAASASGSLSAGAIAAAVAAAAIAAAADGDDSSTNR